MPRDLPFFVVLYRTGALRAILPLRGFTPNSAHEPHTFTYLRTLCIGYSKITPSLLSPALPALPSEKKQEPPLGREGTLVNPIARAWG